jgi:hypothetical protein
MNVTGSRVAPRWLLWGLPVATLVYSVVLIVPRWVPSISFSFLYVFYLLSYAALLAFLAACAAISGMVVLWQLKTRSVVSGRVKYVFFASAIAATCCSVMFALALYLPQGLPAGSWISEFDAVMWRDPASADFGKSVSIRQKMLGDLVSNVLPGKSRDEIIDLLGPSSKTPYFASLEYDLIYPTGAQRDSYIRIDSEWLLIWCDHTGRFERFAIVSD